MRTPLFLACLVPLVVSAATAKAEALRPTPLFEIDVVAAKTHARVTTLQVWQTGGWASEDFRGTTPTTATGRLTAATLHTLSSELARATWKRTYNEHACLPTPELVTEFFVRGTLEWTEPTCGQGLDATSRAVLGNARTLVEDAVAPPPPEVHATPVQGDSDTVIERFNIVRGEDAGKPFLRIDASVARHFGGASMLVVEKAFQSGDSTVYVVSPRPAPSGLPQKGVTVEGPTEESRASYQVPDLQWGKTYTFIVLNYTGGTTADGTSVFTQMVTFPRK